MSSNNTSVTFLHKNNLGHECGGELMFSYDIVDNKNISVYICKKCGKRTELI